MKRKLTAKLQKSKKDQTKFRRRLIQVRRMVFLSSCLSLLSLHFCFCKQNMSIDSRIVFSELELLCNFSWLSFDIEESSPSSWYKSDEHCSFLFLVTHFLTHQKREINHQVIQRGCLYLKFSFNRSFWKPALDLIY